MYSAGQPAAGTARHPSPQTLPGHHHGKQYVWQNQSPGGKPNSLKENNRKSLSNPGYPDAEWLNYFHISNHGQALSNDGQLFSRVVALLNNQPMLQVDYTATATNLDLLTPHQATLEELAVPSAEWDPLMAPVPGGIVGGADLVLCNHAWGPLKTDPGLLVKNLASGASRGGFVLLHTLLKGETLGEIVCFLSNTTKSRSQRGLLTQVRKDIGQLLNAKVDEFFYLLNCLS